MPLAAAAQFTRTPFSQLPAQVLYVPLPPPADRASILRALVRRTPLGPGVDLEAVARDGRCDGFSGADMAALVREAAVAALKEAMAAGPGGVGRGRVYSEKVLCEHR